MHPIAAAGNSILAELRRRSVFQVAAAWLVAGWLLIQVADTVAPQFDLPGWVPRLVTLLVMLGLPVAIVLAWAFEFTAAGIERDAHSRNTRVVVALAVTLAVAAVAWFFRADLAGRDLGERSIAVLPFANLATDADSEVLADGLAEELLGALGRNPSFRVTARSSAFQFKGQNRDLREIGQKLGVRYILEGSVRMIRGRVRIGAQLVDTADGSQLWSESYDRTLADLFALQRDIAYEVERALDVVLVASEDSTPRGTRNVEAHMELLRALQVGASRVVRDLDQAIAHLHRAIALDPQYAAAYVELAYATFTRAMQLGEDQAALPLIAPLLDKALALDPRSGEATVLRGAMLIEDPVLAEKTIREGLALAPSHARGYEILAGGVSQDPARIDEALALLDHAIALDPLSPRNHHMKGILTSQEKGDVPGSRQYFLRAVEVDPRFRASLMLLATVSMAQGEFADAVAYAERGHALDPGTPFMREGLAMHYLNIGELDAARAVAWPGDPMILVFAGDVDAAMAQLRALVQQDPGAARIDPSMLGAIALHHARTHNSWAEDLEFVLHTLGSRVEPPLQLRPSDVVYPHLVALLRGAGDEARAGQLAQTLLERLRRQERTFTEFQRERLAWYRAMVLGAMGRSGETLDALEQAFRPARPFWWLMLDGSPLFEPLRGEPRYQALRARLEQHLEAQRAKLAEMRRSGAVPDRSVVPAEQTGS